MKRLLKRFFGIIISLIIILQSVCISSFANSSMLNEVNGLSNSILEEKVYCNATLEDDFTDDCVLIVIDHENSIVDRIFTASDFPGVDVKKITYLTSPITPLFEESETEVEAQEKAETLNLTNVQDFNHIIRIDLDTTGKNEVLKSIEVLETFSFVLSAEPNYVSQADLPIESTIENVVEKTTLIETNSLTTSDVNENITNDPEIKDPYALEKIHAREAWSITTGSKNIRVGVIDSGVIEHADLIDNLVEGWDFYNNNSLTHDDINGHGTKVAGIIGAVGNNGIGVSGICWNVSIVPLQRSNNSGGTDNTARTVAINYARTQDIPIINCSFTSPGYSATYEEAVENYKGLIVCSAGNEGIDTDQENRYPACFSYDNVISVAATNKNDDLAIFNTIQSSNYGATTVDLAAPGLNVPTTLHNGSCGNFGGTSIAAPHVSGVAALILSVRPDLSAEQVKACILNGVDKVDALEGKCVTGGRLNAYKALQLALDFPKDQMVSGDFDGNGKDDVAYITDSGYGSMKIYVRENGIDTPTLWTEETAFYTANVDDRVTAGDFNGDGKDDIALLYDNKNGKARIHVLLSNGDGFNPRSSWFVQSVEGMYNANRTTGRVTSGDFNGDGLDDVSAMYDNGDGKMRIHMFISTGNSFNWEYWYEDMAGGNFYASGVTGRYEAGDFNGDGKDDIAAMYGYADGRTRVHVWLSNGTSLNQRTAWFIQDTPYYYNTERVNNRFVAGDFNNDGKDDIGTLYEYSGGTMMLHVFVSQGNTFSWWQNWYHSSATGSFYTNAVTGFNSGDYNGDGKMDIMLRYSYQAGYSKLLQYQSNGSSFNYIAKFLYWETLE